MTSPVEGPIQPAPDEAPVNMLRLLPSAALGVGMAVQRRSLRAATAAGARVAPKVFAVVPLLIPPAVAAPVQRHLEYWSARGGAERLSAQRAATAVARRLVREVATAVLDQIDLDEVVSRVDVDQVAARIDVDAIVARIDLVAITQGVLDEIDIGRVVRESGGSMTAETIDAFRVQNMRADRFVDRVADRLLRRADRNAIDSGAPPPDGPS